MSLRKLPLSIEVFEVGFVSLLILSLFMVPLGLQRMIIPITDTVYQNNNSGISDPRTSATTLPDFNSSFQFNLSETCQYDLPWSSYRTTNISIPAPLGYNSTEANIMVQVINATLNQTTIVNNSGPLYVNRTQQAQGFFTSADSLFVGFSLYIPYDKPYTKSLTMQLRNESHSGDTLASFPITLGTSPQWEDVTVSPAIFLPKGHYYLYMPSISGTLTNAWAHTINGNASDTWSYNGLYWSLQNWNLTLKIRTSSIVSPAAVGMTIAAQLVTDLGDGQGLVNISQNITSSPVRFGITNNTQIAYSYTLNATYYRKTTSQYNVSLNDGFANWNLTLPSNDNNFHGYQGNITGIQPDYTDIQVLKGNTVIGYTTPDSSIIAIADFASSVRFKSPNYISSLSCPCIMYGGRTSIIGVNSISPGNISVVVQNQSAIIYQNSTISTAEASFKWVPEASNQPVSVLLQAFYLGTNEIGINSTTIAIHVDTALNAADFCVPALSSVTIGCTFGTLFSQFPIEDANVVFELDELDGQMAYQGAGIYGIQLDLDQFELLPGTYNLTLTAGKEGFRDQTINVSFIIVPRSVIIQLTQSVTRLSPGQPVQFDIDLSDNLTGSYLDHPVDVTLTIYPSHQSPAQNVTTLTISHIIDSYQYTWYAPESIELGDYSVKVTIVSTHFDGILIKSSNLTIVPRAEIWPSVLVMMIVLLIVTSIYIRHEKVQAKRSIKGLMILHSSGAPVAELISPSFSKLDAILISGAISGMISLIREITGSGLRTIRVDGGYLEMKRGSTFWVIILMRKSPAWINKTVEHVVGTIENQYGDQLAKRNGMDVIIDIPALVAQHFGVHLDYPSTPALPTSVPMPETRNEE